MSLNNKKENKSSPLCDRVLSRIDGEDISPCPKWKFLCKDSVVWFLWSVSVVLGAVGVAVMIYVAGHAMFALHEATHDTPLSFFVEVLPYLWIFFFVLMAALAYYNLRHTKYGYRYPLWQITGSSLAVSLIGGVVLNYAGVGYLIDHSFTKAMPTYPSIEKVEKKMWQMPQEGRLVGQFSAIKEDGMYYSVIDTSGEEWSIEITELQEPELELLRSGQAVRILGTTTSLAKNDFHACGVFPWMFDKKNALRDIEKERKEFVKRMYRHMETDDRLKAIEKETFAERTYGRPFMDGACAEIAAVKRMEF